MVRFHDNIISACKSNIQPETSLGFHQSCFILVYLEFRGPRNLSSQNATHCSVRARRPSSEHSHGCISSYRNSTTVQYWTNSVRPNNHNVVYMFQTLNPVAYKNWNLCDQMPNTVLLLGGGGLIRFLVAILHYIATWKSCLH